MNRKRMELEGYHTYRERLAQGEKLLKSRLKGKYFHVSQGYRPVKNDKGESEMELYGITYRKPKEEENNV